MNQLQPEEPIVSKRNYLLVLIGIALFSGPINRESRKLPKVSVRYTRLLTQNTGSRSEATASE